MTSHQFWTRLLLPAALTLGACGDNGDVDVDADTDTDTTESSFVTPLAIQVQPILPFDAETETLVNDPAANTAPLLAVFVIFSQTQQCALVAQSVTSNLVVGGDTLLSVNAAVSGTGWQDFGALDSSAGIAPCSGLLAPSDRQKIDGLFAQPALVEIVEEVDAQLAGLLSQQDATLLDSAIGMNLTLTGLGSPVPGFVQGLPFNATSTTNPLSVDELLYDVADEPEPTDTDEPADTDTDEPADTDTDTDEPTDTDTDTDEPEEPDTGDQVASLNTANLNGNAIIEWALLQ